MFSMGEVRKLRTFIFHWKSSIGSWDISVFVFLWQPANFMPFFFGKIAGISLFLLRQRGKCFGSYFGIPRVPRRVSQAVMSMSRSFKNGLNIVTLVSCWYKNVPVVCRTTNSLKMFKNGVKLLNFFWIGKEIKMAESNFCKKHISLVMITVIRIF